MNKADAKREHKDLLERARQQKGSHDFTMFINLIDAKVEVLKEKLIGLHGDDAAKNQGGILELRELKEELEKVTNENKKVSINPYSVN